MARRSWSAAAFLLLLVLAACILEGSAEIPPGALGRSCRAASKKKDCGTEQLACISDLCSHCRADADCGAAHQICTVDAASGLGTCGQKPLIHPFSRGTDIAAGFVTSIAALGAAAGGIGGGVLFMPLMVLCGYDTHFATYTADAMIVGGMLSQLVLNGRSRHPKRNRPLIEYSVAFGLLPLIIGGTIPGVFLNQLFQDWLILLILATVLTWVIKKSAVKARQVYQKEKKERAAAKKVAKELEAKGGEAFSGVAVAQGAKVAPAAAPAESGAAAAAAKGEPRGADGGAISPEKGLVAIDVEDREDEGWRRRALDAILAAEARTPFARWAVFTVWFAATMFVIYIPGKGSVKTFANLRRCSSEYWGTVFAPAPLVLAAAALVYWDLWRTAKAKAAAGYEYKEGDVKWSAGLIAKMAPFCFVLGIFVGILGIGGGVMMTPLLLELGVHPQAQAATSSFMILYIASSAGVQFLVAGLLPLDYAALYFLLGLASFTAGLTIVNKAVARYRMFSIIVIVLCAVLVLAFSLSLSIGIKFLVEALRSGASVGFNDVCRS
eukprot:tig00000870_g5132.t1